MNKCKNQNKSEKDRNTGDIGRGWIEKVIWLKPLAS